MNVYMSFSRRDERVARRIAEELRKSGFSVWDDSQIAPGTNWASEVAKALEESDAIVLVLSPDYLASRWAQREIEYALSTLKYKGRVITVVVKPTREIPWILERLVRIDATSKSKGIGKQVAEALRSTAEASRE